MKDGVYYDKKGAVINDGATVQFTGANGKTESGVVLGPYEDGGAYRLHIELSDGTRATVADGECEIVPAATPAAPETPTK